MLQCGKIREIARLSASESLARFESSSRSSPLLRSRKLHRRGKLIDQVALEIATTSSATRPPIGLKDMSMNIYEKRALTATADDRPRSRIPASALSASTGAFGVPT
jgi:hypothetical protein